MSIQSDYIYNCPPHILQELRELHAKCGKANRHEQASVLIKACIMNDIDTFGRIIRTLEPLGFDWRHVAAVLRQEGGKNPTNHSWSMGLDRRFTLVESSEQPVS